VKAVNTTALFAAVPGMLPGALFSHGRPCRPGFVVRVRIRNRDQQSYGIESRGKDHLPGHDGAAHHRAGEVLDERR
jgi:hypothetical protein